MGIVEQLTTLFEEAGSAHHEAFAHVDGADEQWAEWYAEYLLPKLSSVLGDEVTVERIASHLADFESERQRESPDAAWAEFYAAAMARRLGLK